MNTLTDFKRELADHPGYWQFTYCDGNVRRSGLRRVVHVQSNAVALWRQGGASFEYACANPKQAATWFYFPKARFCRFDRTFDRARVTIFEHEQVTLTYEKIPENQNGQFPLF